MRRRACEDFVAIHQLWPEIKLWWLDQLPRCTWCYTRSVWRIDVAPKRISAYLGRCAIRLGGRVIRHPKRGWKDAHLFWPNGVYLSREGNDLFLRDLQQGLLEVL